MKCIVHSLANETDAPLLPVLLPGVHKVKMVGKDSISWGKCAKNALHYPQNSYLRAIATRSTVGRTPFLIVILVVPHRRSVGYYREAITPPHRGCCHSKTYQYSTVSLVCITKMDLQN